ncbi:MAG: HAD family hydrolase [Candidatus Hodarchaeota archaeon]
MSFKAVLFDLWETLIFETADLRSEWNRKRLAAFSRILGKWNSKISLKAIQNSYFKVQNEFKEKQQTELLVMTPVEQVETILSDLKIQLNIFPNGLKEELIDLYTSAALNPVPKLSPEARTVLKTVDNFGLAIGIVSNTWSTPGVILRKVLDQYGIKDYFSFMLFSDEFGSPKPHKAIFEKALSYFPQILPQECVFVGDNYIADICGAKAVGMKDIKNQWVILPKTNACIDYRVESLIMLLSLLANHLD